MPVYEYRCPDCGAVFSKMRPMSQADAPVECERCGKRNARRMLSRIAPVRREDGAGASAGGGCAGCSSANCSTCGR